MSQLLVYYQSTIHNLCANKSNLAGDTGISVIGQPGKGTITPANPVVRVTGVRFGYGGGKALHAGKSTLLCAITGMIVSSVGEVQIEGMRIPVARSPFRLARGAWAEVTSQDCCQS